MVTVPGGYPIAGNNFPSLTVTSPADARDKIGSLVDDGADVIKITLAGDDAYPTLSPEEAAAIVDTAHLRGIPVTAHAEDALSLQLALDAGVDDVSHIATDQVPDEDIRRMVANGVYWVPTFEPLDRIDLDILRCLLTIGGQHNLRRFMAAGGQVALGNDGGYMSGIQIGMPISEIEFMQKAGMTPAFVGFRSRSHIAIDTLVVFLPPRVRRDMNRCVEVVVLAILGLFVWQGVRLCLTTWGLEFPALEISRGYLYLSLPVGASLMIIALVGQWHRTSANAHEREPARRGRP